MEEFSGRKSKYFFDAFKEKNVIIPGHFELTSGRHTSEYISKDVLTANASFDNLLEELCKQLAFFAYDGNLIDIDVVAAPATGGINLGYLVAKHLSGMIHKNVSAVYAERKKSKKIYDQMEGYGKRGMLDVYIHDVFEFREEFVRRIRFKNVFVVDDILTTGMSLKGVIDAVRLQGGIAEYAGVIWNRGRVDAEDIIVKKIFSAINKKIEDWESPCPLCKKGIPLIRLK
ncbi:MAG: phosphoribosyltransferase family protein [bacterium]|nr:phosphoribosyltransferase family protein [bacterium]